MTSFKSTGLKYNIWNLLWNHKLTTYKSSCCSKSGYNAHRRIFEIYCEITNWRHANVILTSGLVIHPSAYSTLFES